MTDRSWTVTASRYVLKDRWISVRADDCRTPSGTVVAPYYVIESSNAVHVLAFDETDRAILVRQYRHPYGGLTLELPGGRIDPGETDPLMAAARELREETGYGGGTFEAAAILSVDPPRIANRTHFVVAHGVIPGKAAPDPSEEIEIVLIPRDELRALACRGDLVTAAHLGMILLALLRAEASGGRDKRPGSIKAHKGTTAGATPRT
ncbi:NUDIX hydrolase [Methylobacterium sp. GC_Met_2]|uniref:NUDIX hydrolase n=1 Tax=Methylobacterium sp. GC_Met_2 TaxID=2937376 RepID=UPI00226B3EBA